MPTAPGHKIYPYLLRKMQAVRPDQVWAMDITYIPMARGFVYLAVEIGRLHVATLMKRMGIEAIYRKPNTSKPAPWSIGSAAGFSAIGCRLPFARGTRRLLRRLNFSTVTELPLL
jgi:transposase InsO family protein